MGWTPKDKSFVLNNLNIKTIEELAQITGHSVMSITLFLHRRRLTVGRTIEHNLCQKLLKLRFPDVNCFQPTRSFYDTVKISQKRFWDIYMGRKPMTDIEYCSMSKYFGISLEEALMARQLTLFNDDRQ